jgi:formylglycine-generating enzyme required for sulfatase activity
MKLIESGKLFILCVLCFGSWSCSGIAPTESLNGDMVRVPAGPFPMGAVIENDHEWGDTDEEPVHEVTLSEYSIDRYEVTAQDFAEFLNAHSDEAERYIEMGTAVTIEKSNGVYRSRPGLEKHPVNRVSWFGADAFCRSLGKRLPTEAEWEKAARGTDERIFPWGDEFPHNDFVTFRRRFSKYGFDAMKPVDALPEGKSPYGVYHMAGNVWEWVADWYEDSYYEHSPQKDPQGPETGISKVLRGGNWYYKAYYMRTTYRFNEHPDAFKVWQGFRCAQ